MRSAGGADIDIAIERKLIGDHRAMDIWSAVKNNLSDSHVCGQRLTFCDALGFADLKRDASLATNNQRVTMRPTLMPLLRTRLAKRSASELCALFEKVGLPFAPIRKPEDLYQDPHLIATGGLADVRLSDGPRAGDKVKTTLFPFTMDGERLQVRLHPPRLGQHSRELLAGIGVADAEVDRLLAMGVVA